MNKKNALFTSNSEIGAKQQHPFCTLHLQKANKGERIPDLAHGSEVINDTVQSVT